MKLLHHSDEELVINCFHFIFIPQRNIKLDGISTEENKNEKKKWILIQELKLPNKINRVLNIYSIIKKKNKLIQKISNQQFNN